MHDPGHDSSGRGAARDRALVRAAGSAVVSRLLVMVAGVLALTLAARDLDEAELGVVVVLAALQLLIGLGDLGLGTLLLTRLPAALASGDEAGARRLVAVTLGVTGSVGALVGIVGVASAPWVPWATLLGAEELSSGTVTSTVVALFVTLGVGIPSSVGGRVLLALQRGASLAAWTSATAVLGVAAAGLCAAVDAPPWAFFLALAAAPSLVGVVQTAWVLLVLRPDLRPGRLRLERDALGHLRAGALYATANVTVLVNYYVDALVVSAVKGAEAGAVFALAARLFSMVGSTITLAVQQLWSAMSDAIARGDVAWVRSRFRRALLLAGGLNALGCLVLVVVGKDVVRVWVGAELVPPLSLLLVLAVWTVVSNATVQGSYLLGATERLRTVVVTSVLMVPVNLGLSIALTHRYGLVGPLLGSLIALALVQAVPLVVATRRLLADLEAGALSPTPSALPDAP